MRKSLLLFMLMVKNIGKNTAIKDIIEWITLNLPQYDEEINSLWRECVQEYALGNISRDEAINKFRQNVYNELVID